MNVSQKNFYNYNVEGYLIKPDNVIFDNEAGLQSTVLSLEMLKQFGAIEVEFIDTVNPTQHYNVTLPIGIVDYDVISHFSFFDESNPTYSQNINIVFKTEVNGDNVTLTYVGYSNYLNNPTYITPFEISFTRITGLL